MAIISFVFIVGTIKRIELKTVCVRQNHEYVDITPIIKSMQVIPVAGHDSMLMNIGGVKTALSTKTLFCARQRREHRRW